MGEAMWLIFLLLVSFALVIDSWLLKRKNIYLVSLGWISLGLLFSLVIDFGLGKHAALDYLTGFFLEKSLSVDNLLVISGIFTALSIPSEHQKKVLFLGVLGAAVLRLIFIKWGIYFIHHFAFAFYLFGAILCYSAFTLLPFFHKKLSIEKTLIYRVFKKILPLSSLHKEAFFTISNKKIFVTPLFLALLLVEISDIIFAVDSIPAILSITDNTYIAFTSNFFAVLGLRSLHLILSDIIGKLPTFRYGTSIILFFIGLKMLLKKWIEIPNGISLLCILGTLIGCYLLAPKRKFT